MGTRIRPPWEALDGKGRRRKAAPPVPTVEGISDAELNFEIEADWPHIQPRTKAARRVFLAEFLKDFNGTNAALRTGYCTEKNARNSACRWLAEPFTQWLLDRMLTELKEDAIVTRREVLAGLKREAFNNEPGASASRVKAWSTLGKLLGMEVTKLEGNVTVSAKVMTVPLATTPEEFEAVAMFRQAKLRRECADATHARN